MLGIILATILAAGAPPGPDSELAAAHAHLKSGIFGQDEINYIRYFTTYAMPEAVRTACEAALPFVLNSTACSGAEGFIAVPRRVPGSGTLWFADIRDYGWAADGQVDEVFGLQPYFLNPLVDAAGSILFRADWFVVNAMDATWQDDRGQKKVIPYYVLQYGLGREPKDADDFRKAWLVDLDTIRVQKLERGTVVNAGDSGVSKHTRQLRRGRTLLGYYWESRDVKTHDVELDNGKSRDFVEDIFAKQADAGELIASNKRGLQTYLLTAGNKDNFKRVEFGDPTVVIDRSDPVDPRVRTGKSCLVCHGVGINPASNVIRDIIAKGGDIKVYYKDLYREIRAFYLQDLDGDIEDDNRIFERAVRRCNGLTPPENAAAYVAVYDWYRSPVDPEQAARECGLGPDHYRKAIAATTTGRLTLLYHGRPMPRDVWDSPNVGGYVQSMLLIKRIVRATAVAAYNRTPIYAPQSNRPLAYMSVGEQASVISDHGRWLWVRYGGHVGYLNKGHVR